jgi:hypothetical protein
MANTFFKSFAESDRTSSRTLLHEAIPITGTLVSGTYNTNDNVKAFSHEMFKSVYDYPYLSSSANHIFDVSYGFNTLAGLYNTTGSQAAKKLNMYTQMAQVLAGFDTNGVVRSFDTDGNYSTDGDKMTSVFFVSFSRLLVKDEIKKGSFSMSIGTGSNYLTPFSEVNVVTDATATTSYKINSPAGEFGILNQTAKLAAASINFTNSPVIGNAITVRGLGTDGITLTTATFTVTGAGGATDADEFARDGANNGAANFVTALGLSTIAALVTVTRAGDIITITQKTVGSNGNTSIASNLANVSINGGTAAAAGSFIGGRTASGVGHIYYQAGIAVLTSSVLGVSAQSTVPASIPRAQWAPSVPDDQSLIGGSGSNPINDAFIHRIQNIQFNNTTELNSTIYFCRANHNEFNYSSNPTYLSDSKIVVKANELMMPPRSYATTVGLYSADNELLAVAKLSEPLRKDPTNELTLRVRLDY